MINRQLVIALLAAVFVFVAAGWSLTLSQLAPRRDSTPSPQELIRLHILANSDSSDDQALKLKVRDAVVEYLSPRLAAADTIDTARRIVATNQNQIAQVAQAVLAANNSQDGVRVEMGRFEFPLRTYGSLVLPSGEYEAVRVLIGAAEGKNWWCVLFPPLCIVDATNAAAAPASPADGSEMGRAAKIEFRWKLAELWNASQK